MKSLFQTFILTFQKEESYLCDMYKVFVNVDQRIKVLACLITFAGVVPFYVGLILFIFNQVYPFISFYLIVYSGLIITFVCGSNWVIILSNSFSNREINLIYFLFFIVNSIIPILLSCYIIVNESFNGNSYSFLYLGFILVLLLCFDLIFLLNRMIETWWFKLRLFGSLSSGIALIIINVINL